MAMGIYIIFYKPTFWLNFKEYVKICSEINQIYEAQYKGKHFRTFYSVDSTTYVHYNVHIRRCHL